MPKKRESRTCYRAEWAAISSGKFDKLNAPIPKNHETHLPLLTNCWHSKRLHDILLSTISPDCLFPELRTSFGRKNLNSFTLTLKLRAWKIATIPQIKLLIWCHFSPYQINQSNLSRIKWKSVFSLFRFSDWCFMSWESLVNAVCLPRSHGTVTGDNKHFVSSIA